MIHARLFREFSKFSGKTNQITRMQPYDNYGRLKSFEMMYYPSFKLKGRWRERDPGGAGGDGVADPRGLLDLRQLEQLHRPRLRACRPPDVLQHQDLPGYQVILYLR